MSSGCPCKRNRKRAWSPPVEISVTGAFTLPPPCSRLPYSLLQQQQRFSFQRFRLLLEANLRGCDCLRSPAPRKTDTHVLELTPRSTRASLPRAPPLGHPQFYFGW